MPFGQYLQEFQPPSSSHALCLDSSVGRNWFYLLLPRFRAESRISTGFSRGVRRSPGHVGQVAREALDLLERQHLAPAAGVVHVLCPVFLGEVPRLTAFSRTTRQLHATAHVEARKLTLGHSAETQILHSSAARRPGRQGPAPHRSLWPETFIYTTPYRGHGLCNARQSRQMDKTLSKTA